MRIGALIALRRLGRNRAGATTVEFALVAPVFFLILFSMIETGVVLTRISTLDDAVSASARLIYTGQAPSRAALEAEICDRAAAFANCEQNINIELTPVSDFGFTPPTDPECRDAGDATFAPATSFITGAGSEIIFMRVCVTTDILTPGLGFGLALPKTDNGRLQVISTFAFMNEPF